MHSADLERLLRRQKECARDDGSGDVVFAMFLEPHDPPYGLPPPSLFDRLVDFVVKNMQPSPIMTHVELFIPCAPGAGLPVHFATYIDGKSSWRASREQNRAYYLEDTAQKWLAIPVFANHAAKLARGACECGVKYSLFRYVTAAWGIRSLSGLVPDYPRSPAHCATLTARILRATGANLKHASAYYGPSSLYAELTNDIKGLSIDSESTNLDAKGLSSIETLLRADEGALSKIADQDAHAAFRILTLKVAAAHASGDSAAQRVTQKQLANALLRWSVMKNGLDSA